MLRIYMGEGVGKTTAAAGLALRAAAHGRHVRVLQLLKPQISPEFAWLCDAGQVSVTLANPDIPFFHTLQESEKALRRAETERAVAAFFTVQAGDFLLVADEMGGALENGMLAEKRLCSLLEALPDTVHVVLTGRYFPKTLVDAADCVSEIRCVRHPYQNGVPAIEGLEY